MSVYTGFGVNYKALQSNWAKDMAYFNSIGLNSIRVHLQAVSIPWSVGTITNGSYAYWRYLAETWSNAGFWVTWGPNWGSGSLTSSNWGSYHDAVVAEANYLQGQSISLGDFEIGNELENSIDGTTLTYQQLASNLRQLALDVKAVYSLSPISYGATASTGILNNFINNGLGGLDTISIHPYGSINVAAQTVAISQWTNVQAIVQTYGSRCYISEFNLDTSSTNLAALNANITVTTMENFLNTYILGLEVSRFLVYEWCEYLNSTTSDYGYTQLRPNGSINPMWFDFFQSKPKYYTPRNTGISRILTPLRPANNSRTTEVSRYLVGG